MTGPTTPQDSAALAKAHAALLRHSDFQFSLPSFQEPKVPEWLRALQAFLSKHWTAVEWTFWIVAGAIVLGVAVVLIRQYWPLLRDRQWKRPQAEPARQMAEWRPTTVQARRLLEEADALAAQGQYAEAVHVLLLRSIQDIEERRPQSLRRAFTSREIERLQALPDAARAAFSGISRVVERTLFAHHAIGAAEFARCRKEYEDFAFPGAWRLAR